MNNARCSNQGIELLGKENIQISSISNPYLKKIAQKLYFNMEYTDYGDEYSEWTDHWGDDWSEYSEERTHTQYSEYDPDYTEWTECLDF